MSIKTWLLLLFVPVAAGITLLVLRHPRIGDRADSGGNAATATCPPVEGQGASGPVRIPAGVRRSPSGAHQNVPGLDAELRELR